jgi:hypothetical protein
MTLKVGNLGYVITFSPVGLFSLQPSTPAQHHLARNAAHGSDVASDQNS